MPYKFEIRKDKAGEYRAMFRAPNGEIMFATEGYKSKASAKNAIEAVQKNVRAADIEDFDVAVSVSLIQVVKSPFCVAIDDGNAVHKLIADGLDANKNVSVSFSGVKRLTTAFLNAAIGQLYNEYDEDIIRDNIRLIDASQDDLRLLKRVVDNAKKFFKRPELRSGTIRDLLGDD